MNQHKNWLLYAIITPVILLVITSFVYLAGTTKVENLFFLYLGLVAFSATVWWLWTMYVIYQILNYQKKAVDLIEELHIDIMAIKVSVLEEKDLIIKK